jgi:hypothetical protein
MTTPPAEAKVMQNDREAGHVLPMCAYLRELGTLIGKRDEGVAQAAFRAGWNTRASTPSASAGELVNALPDEIDLFRAIRAAGRKNIDKARAVRALLDPIEAAIRSLTEARAGEKG